MQVGTITLTFGDVAENHTGMERIGTMVDKGFTSKDIRSIYQYLLKEYELENDAGQSGIELVDMSKFLNTDYDGDSPLLLIIPEGIQLLLNSNTGADKLLEEQSVLPYDKKAWMKGRVVNKKARYNLCFSESDSSPNYEQKRGTVIAYDRVPLLNSLREEIMNLLKNSLNTDIDLKVESNYYYDTEKCYIGWHGDTERRVVIGCRLGAEYPLSFRWYRRNTPVSNIISVHLQHGDIYVMSDKCTGYDWKKSSILTLRHSAGYIPLKE